MKEPKTVDIVEMVPNKGPIGKAFKKEAKNITDMLSKLSLDDITKHEADLEAKGEFKLSAGITIKKVLGFLMVKLPICLLVSCLQEMVLVKRQTKTVYVEKIVPSVVEPSFGVGRIMYAIFEHNFKVREGDEQRTYFSLPASIAPLKCSVLPLSTNPDFTPIVKQISKSLTEAEVSHKVDDSSGKKMK